MDAKERVFTIDLGTSGPKVALFTMIAELIDLEFEPVKLYLLPGGGAEQDPREWWQAIVRAARRLNARNRSEACRVSVVSCTGQWSGTVAVDCFGEPLMNAIIWMDMRGAPYVKKISDRLAKVFGHSLPKFVAGVRLTGAPPGHAGKDSLAHILYIKNRLPSVYRETYKFLEPKDWINLLLTERFASSYDAITSHFVTDNGDLGRIVDNDRLFALSGVSCAKLPELVSALDFLGPLTWEASGALGLPFDARVVAGTPGIFSAAIGRSSQNFVGPAFLGKAR